MRDKLIFAGLFVAGLAILGASWWNLNAVSAQTTEVPADHDGPVMVIEVAGEANGTLRIALRDDLAPNHVDRMVTLAESGAYDGVVFHRVIEGFMAQNSRTRILPAGLSAWRVRKARTARIASSSSCSRPRRI